MKENIDKPIKLKSPEIRLQVTFIDNEEYFKRKGIYYDGLFFEDNDELMCNFLNKKNSVGWLAIRFPFFCNNFCPF